MQQAQCILPMIDTLLKDHQLSLAELDALAFGCGPGSFTGVRIATSVAQGLGFATPLPLISVSSLAALAQSAFLDLGWKKLLVAVDARMQEIYWGMYQINEEGRLVLVGEEMVCRPDKLVFPEAGDWYGVGNAWEVYQGQFAYSPCGVDATRMPMASGVAILARQLYLEGKCMAAADAEPVYLRNNIAAKR